MANTISISAADFDQLMSDSMMSEPTGYCTTCEELFEGVAEPDAENYECGCCGKRTLHGAMRIVEDVSFGGIQVEE